MDFTKKQNQAITSKGNILVSAAAGSGKTRVLTERICRIVSNENIDILDILVLTFTDLAAAEMKNRIYHGLYDMSIKKENEQLGIMAEQAVKADISTIHSFCQKIIREKYYVVGLSPSFRIGSEKESSRTLKKCLAELLEKKVSSKDKNILKLYHKYGKRNGNHLSEIILNIYRNLIVLPEPNQHCEKILKAYETKEYKSRIEDVLKKDVVLRLTNSKEILTQLLQISKNLSFIKAEEVLTGYLDELIIHIKDFKIKFYEDYILLPFMKKQFRIDKMDDEIKEFFKKNKDVVAKSVKGTKELSYLKDFNKNYENEIKEIIKDASLLFNLVFELMEIYQRKKSQLNFLDFNDLEHFAYEILKDNDNAKSFQYKYIFIDEYQDTNPLQEAIISKIKKADNLFMVGDIKQSIYSFRHAEPSIFLKKQNEYREFDSAKESTENELIRMNENFRSSKKVVDSINLIMENLITLDFGKIDYKNKESLVYKSALKSGEVGISLIDTDETIIESDEQTKRLSPKEAEAINIAKQINSILGETFYSREQKKEMQIEYSDIVILLRELKTTGPIYKRVLESYGIPVDCEIESVGSRIPETEVFSNLLKTISNPTDDIALLSIMHFDFFGFTPDNFAAIRSIDSTKKASFYDCMSDYMGKKDDALSKKVSWFYDKIKNLKYKSKCLTKEDFLNYCISKVNFEEILSTHPKRSIKVDILRGFVSTLISETPKNAGLSRIVEFIDSMKSSGDILSSTANFKNPNSVRIMTIHKSKGLEFPVVFLAGLDKALTIANKDSVIIDKDLGLGFKQLIPSKNFGKTGIIYQGISQKQKFESMEESLRILYVAMTRAENRLYFIGGRKQLKSSFSKWIVSGKSSRFFAASFMDLIVPNLINKKGFIEGFSISRFLPPTLCKFENIKFNVLPKQLYNKEDKEDRGRKLEDFLAITPRSIEIGYKYSYKDSLKTPSKKSVSSLKEDIKKIKPQVSIRSYDEISSLSASEKGTAFHVFMQHVDFNTKDIEGIKSQIELLVKNQFLSLDEAKTLDLNSIMAVLDSDIIKRAKKSPLIYKEKNFTLKVKSEDIGLNSGEIILIQGTIDLCFLEDGGFVVVDYKTDKGDIKLLKERIKGYTDQINIYSTAVEKLTKEPVKEKYLYFINSQLFKIVNL